MDIEAVKICRGACYKNLWALNNKERQTDKRIQFYLYLDALWDVTGIILRLTNEVATKYRRHARLSIGAHAIHIHEWHDVEHHWLMTKYKLTDEELDVIINECPLEWKVPFNIEELLKTKTRPPLDISIE